MRNYEVEVTNRIHFIQNVLSSSGASGIVFGNSGGKDSALVGILCKMACENTLGLMMPCGSRQNYGEDMKDAMAVAEQFNIATRVVDLSDTKMMLIHAMEGITLLTDAALTNMSPRLRMTTLYAVAASENRLVAGTGNRSEVYMGYFTKWGDGAFDFNPVADLTVTEIYEFLQFLHAPVSIISKAPSAGLFDGQTDESEMGVTYESIDKFLLHGMVNDGDRAIMERYHRTSEHKRVKPMVYGD